MNDTTLRKIFSQSRRTMPAELENRLLTIPASVAAKAQWRLRAVYLAASVPFVFLFGSSMVRLLKVASYNLGIWSLEMLNTTRYTIYDVIMEQASPWIENVPLGFSGALAALTLMSLAFSLWVIVRQQSTAQLPTLLRP